VALGAPTVVVLAARRHATAPLGAVPTSAASTSPSVAPGNPSPMFGGTPTAAPPIIPTHTSSTTADAVKLSPRYTPPTFPYSLPATDGVKAPVASMYGGKLIAFFEATESQHHADITVTVSSRKPTYPTSATQTAEQVRGHTGILRTVNVQPAKQLTLYWQESSTRWVQLATDDTYTPEQVVALANSLTPASVAVAPPFSLDLSPAGLLADTVTESTMSFRAAGATPGNAGFRVVLHRRRPLSDTNETVNGYQALLTHGANGVRVDVDVTDWNATLEVTVASGLTISDADLLRFTAGVHILNRSNPTD
jgi:hypothetical protein